MCSFFTRYVSEYDLRRKRTLTVPKPKTDFMKISITYQTIFLWNNLDNLAKSVSDSGAFERFLKSRGGGGGAGINWY